MPDVLPARPATTPLATWGPLATALAAVALFVAVAPAGAGVPAGAGLGVPPPGGSPLWCVVVAVAAWLPFGDLAWRAQLASAAAGAVAVWATARVVIAARGEPDAAAAWGGIAAGALLATALVFLRAATGADAHALTVAILAVAALLLERVASGDGAAAGLGLAIACGLGLAADRSFAWIAPVAALLYAVRLYRGARFPLAAPAVAAVVAGALWAYLPARAASLDAPPRTIAAAIDHARGDAVAPASAGARARAIGEDVADSLGPLGAVAALAGAVVLWRRRRTAWVAAALTGVAALDLAWAITADAAHAGAPVVWAGAAFAGAGIAALVRLTGRFAPVAGAAAAALCVLPAALLSVPLVA